MVKTWQILMYMTPSKKLDKVMRFQKIAYFFQFSKALMWLWPTWISIQKSKINGTNMLSLTFQLYNFCLKTLLVCFWVEEQRRNNLHIFTFKSNYFRKVFGKLASQLWWKDVLMIKTLSFSAFWWRSTLKKVSAVTK